MIAGPGSPFLICMCANRLSDTNADLCTDRKSRLSHDISCLFGHSFARRILIIGRDARNLSFVRFKTYTDNSYAM